MANHYALRDIFYNPTKYCNLLCQHCWVSPKVATAERLAAEDGLSFEGFKHIVDQALELGLRGIKYTGGEPLLKQDLHHFLRYAHDNGITQWFETNLTHLPQELEDTLVHIDPLTISTSIDHLIPEEHDRLRGKKGAFETTVKNLKTLASHGLNMQIVYTISKANVETILGLQRFGAECGANTVKVNILQPMGRGKTMTDKDMALSIKEIFDIREQMYAQDAPDLPGIVFDVPVAFRTPAELQAGGIPRCNIMETLGLLSDGSASLCGVGYFVEGLHFGHALKEPLAEIWNNSPALQRIRIGIPQELEGICGRCLFKHNCVGACRAEAYHRTKNIRAPFWLCEEAHKHGLFPEERLLPAATF